VSSPRPESAPSFELLSLTATKKINWDLYTAIALPIRTTDGTVEIVSDGFTTAALQEIQRSATDLLAIFPDATGKAGEIFVAQVDHPSIKHIYLVGIGDESREDLRKAGIALARKSKGNKAKIICSVNRSKATAVVFVNALILANFTWSLKSKKEESHTAFTLVGTYENELARALVIGYSTWRTRVLIHTPSNIKNPLWLANEAKKRVSQSSARGLSIRVLSGRELKRFGGLLAVGNSAPKPGPRMVEITYAPPGSKNWPHVVLVGKGITFDTGGISLKRPYDFMIPMKTDMTGAAVVLGAITGAAELAPRIRITALMMCAENAVSSTSQRPSDVIVQYDGQSVEISDTDAEGRLVLADGLAYANLELNPDYIIDVATLTGAATLALGRRYSAMYSRDSKLAASLTQAGENICEPTWRMPLVDDYAPAIKSEIADLIHVADREHFSAGSITAALFLEKFVSTRTWAHLDIAGPARSETDAGENPKGGTAYGVRLLIEWLTSF
jgi:leucyl aminopeptidase